MLISSVRGKGFLNNSETLLLFTILLVQLPFMSHVSYKLFLSCGILKKKVISLTESHKVFCVIACFK